MLKKTTNNRRIAIMGVVGGELSPRAAAEQTGNEDENKSQNENSVIESDIEFDSEAGSSELSNEKGSVGSKEELKVARQVFGAAEALSDEEANSWEESMSDSEGSVREDDYYDQEDYGEEISPTFPPQEEEKKEGEGTGEEVE